jgi:type IV pilus assembly protein PilQ
LKHKHLHYFFKYIICLLLATSLISLIVGVKAEIDRKTEKTLKEIPLYSLNNIKVIEKKEQIEVVLENSNSPSYITFFLCDPPRIVVNILNAIYKCPQKKIIVNKDGVISIRSSQFQDFPVKISRVVIDLNKKLKYKVFSKDNQIILSIEKKEFKALQVSSLNVIENKDIITLEISTYKDIEYKSFRLDDPKRIVLDLSKATLCFKKREINIGKLNIERVRISQYKEEPEKVVRIVVDLLEDIPYRVERKEDNLYLHLGRIKKVEKVKEIEIRKLEEKKEISLPEIAKKIEEEKLPPKKVPPKEKKKKIPPKKKEVKLVGIRDLIGREKKIAPEDVLISMDFRNANIIDVLRMISYKTGVNIVASKDVRGRVTIKLDKVSWRIALSVLLNAYGYSFVEEGNVIRVDSKEKLMKEAVVTKVFVLQYADAAKLATSLKNMLTVGIGTINYDIRTNSVIITDNFKVINAMNEIIRKLDTPAPQVIIEAKIVEVTLSDEERLGIKWSVKPLGIKENVSGEVGLEISPDSPDITTRGYLNIGTIQKGFNINAQISALIQEGKLDVLSNPRIVALNGQEAKIIVGEEVPYKTTTLGEAGTATEEVSFKEVGIKLVVTPTINPDNYITLKIHPEVSDVKEWKYEMPVISKRESDSLVMVKNGETIVVGGLIKDKKIVTHYGVPYLRKIPILGRLFKKKFIETKKTELLIFITPTIINYNK